MGNMNYIEFTESIIGSGDVLIFGPGYNTQLSSSVNSIYNYINNDLDILAKISEIKKNGKILLFDQIIMSRVFEHIPCRNVDYYLCEIASIMRLGAILEIIVPNMSAVVNALELCNKWDFNFLRLNFELFSEGGLRDRHSLWTTEKTVPMIVEQEKQFKLVEMKKVHIDTTLVPENLWFTFKKI